MNLTYRGLWRWHFHAGMLCIPFVMVLAITGSIYLFKPQIDAFADRAVDSLVVGQRATGEQHIAAALASLPGSRLFVYEVPREADDAVRVHVYGPDGAGRIVYVHPGTLAILKTVPHTARLTEIVRMIHANLMAGRGGALLLELAASWAIVMLITGLYLWWPREARGLAGAAYPRFTRGSRVFWRDLHAVTGVWISALALFLLITALPWTTVAGNAIQEARDWFAPAAHEWNLGGRRPPDEHAGHRAAAAAGTALATPLTVDQVIARIAPLRLEPPVRLYLPDAGTPHWRVRSETQNRPRARELALDRMTGDVIRDADFAGKSPGDKAILIGIAAHEGQLFGLPNQLLGLFTALGLLTLCTSGVVMWWRRRPGGSIGIPAPRVPEFRIGARLWVAIVALGLLVPMLGLSLVLLVLIDLVRRGTTRAQSLG